MVFWPKYLSTIFKRIFVGLRYPEVACNVGYQGTWGADSTDIPTVICLDTMKLEMQSITKVTFKLDLDVFV